MSLEDKFDQLINVLEELIVRVDKGMFFEYEKDEDNHTPEQPGERLIQAGEGRYADEREPEIPKARVVSSRSTPEVISVNQREMDLIDISKSLGIPYLQQGDKLIVDNRVLDEYNRRELGD